MLTELWTLWIGQFAVPEQAVIAFAGLALALPAVAWGVERFLWSRPADAVAAEDAATGAAPVWPNGIKPAALKRVAPWGPKVRVMVFMDHPNFGKSWQTEALNLGWKRFERFGWPEVLLVLKERVAVALNRPLAEIEFVGVHVYDSFVPLEHLIRRGVTLQQAEEHYGHGSRHRLLTRVATLPGIFVHLEDRTLKFSHARRVHGHDVIANEEKGVDTAIAADMVRHAGQEHFDVAVLMADDTDYLPLLRTMRDHLPQIVLSAGFHRDTRLRSVAWGRIDFDQAFMLATRNARIARTGQEEALVTVAPAPSTTPTVTQSPGPVTPSVAAPAGVDRAEPSAADQTSALTPRAVIKPALTQTSVAAVPSAAPVPMKTSAKLGSSSTPRKRISFGTIIRDSNVQALARPAEKPKPREPNAWDLTQPADQSMFAPGTEVSACVVAYERGRLFIIGEAGAPTFRGVINRSSFIDKKRCDSMVPGSHIAVVVKGFNERGTMLAIPRDGARVDLAAKLLTEAPTLAVPIEPELRTTAPSA